jgi:hypothetical protein
VDNVHTNSETIALWTLIAGVAGSVIKQYFDARRQDARWRQQQEAAAQRHRWESEDRARIAAELKANTELTKQQAIKTVAAIEENTVVTRDVERKVEQILTDPAKPPTE